MRIAFGTTTAAAVLAAALPAHAQTVVAPENARAEDVVTAPLSDVNLMRRAVPTVLKAALTKPYSMDGISTCAGLTTAIADLDVALGADIDVAQGQTPQERMSNGAAVVAKSVIGSFIPFRGVLREISGANAQERAWQRALYAGSVRRAFLKGMGEQRGCAYPARSATPEVLAVLAARRAPARPAKAEEKTAGRPVDPGNGEARLQTVADRR